MALNAFLKLKGQKQGDIKGSVTQKGRENKIMVIAANHEIVSPRDAASGLAKAKIIHQPFTITKEVDKSTPLLYNALVNNENLTEFTLEFWKVNRGARAVTGTGTETQYYTVKLINASISDIKFTMLNNKNPDWVNYAEYEEISFVYERIEWTWVDGGIMSSDDWKP